MSETTDLVLYCREIRLLATFWWGCAIAGGIVAIAFGCLYHFGVRFRLPRQRATIKRLARERDIARAEREAAIANAADDSARAGAALVAMRARIEAIGVQAQKDLAEADGRALRERTIRKKTEAALIEQKDLASAMEGLLTSMNLQHVEPGSPDSWVPAQPAEGA